MLDFDGGYFEENQIRDFGILYYCGPQLLGTKDWFHGRQFVPGPGQGRGVMIQVQ